MRIALVLLPLCGVDMPPLGIAYIAAKLIENGYNVNVFCFNSQLYQGNKDKRFLWDWDKSNEWESAEKINRHFDVNKLIEKWVSEILKINPEIVGFSVNSHSRVLANLLADKLKEKRKDLFIIFGGPWCIEVSGEVELNKNIDIYVRGEGEGIISEIAKKISRNESIRDLNIKGTLVNTGYIFKDNGWNTESLDINMIPFPALHLFDFDRYTNKEEIPIIFSRGCNHCCKFCTDKPMWGNYRMRKADNIIEEMGKHNQLFRRKNFKCNDLMVNGDINRLNELSEKIIQLGLDFNWGGMARASFEITEDMYIKLRKSGCSYLTYGIESGASRVLSHMGKPNKKSITKALKLTHRAKIKVNTLWMVGYPTENWRDILETVSFLFKNRNYIDQFVTVSSCYIPKQSWLWKQRESLRINFDDKSDWYIDRKNTFSIRESRKRRLLFFARLLGLYQGGIS